ncbi:hypothetical protein, unlikely [Trypanosoma brucei gambiense DAL972]|uniref:Uncharacterized protein n=1 Tax=Trypanosoma brucei gambiense (strain MHOM/CI/86/DAL972) TaxID=679716 RepID=C9ZRN6_TRYB9|nr:hypothetical protein, unlikely [Trypanosoma brucei gambiense DAL972]CBH12022.1 hypothetical protein, unlikely [Trypanosoma brucei gambiense DAL972]|eukprot:XP_011774305.1 hypothetical protein, unlikely [Trypanosoma brucei gambiense DAL972]
MTVVTVQAPSIHVHTVSCSCDISMLHVGTVYRILTYFRALLLIDEESIPCFLRRHLPLSLLWLGATTASQGFGGGQERDATCKAIFFFFCVPPGLSVVTAIIACG